MTTTFRRDTVIAKWHADFRAFDQNRDSICAERVRAEIVTKSGSKHPIPVRGTQGNLTIDLDTVGKLLFHFTLPDTTVTLTCQIVPFSCLAGLGKYEEGKVHQLGVGEFRAQGGVRARVTGFDMSATCKVLGFEVVRISRFGKEEKAHNRGSRFDGPAQDLINAAESGNVYLFRNGRYKCPGADAPQHTGEIRIEIKCNSEMLGITSSLRRFVISNKKTNRYACFSSFFHSSYGYYFLACTTPNTTA